MSVGFFTAVGYIWIATRIRRKAFTAYAAVWTALNVAVWVLITNVDIGTKQRPVDTPASHFVSTFVVLAWLGSSAMAFFVNRSWLRWRASHPRGTSAWYQSGAEPSKPAARPSPSPVLGGDGGTSYGHLPQPESLHIPSVASAVPGSTPQRSASPSHTQPGQVALDLNRVVLGDLTAAGLSASEAQAVLTARERIGGYRSTDQMMTAAGLPPHVFLKIKDRFTAHRPPAAPPTPPSGRVLDL